MKNIQECTAVKVAVIGHNLKNFKIQVNLQNTNVTVKRQS